MGRATLRLLKVALYAALIGLLLASYVTPLQEILTNKALISDLRTDLAELENGNTSRQRAVEELETPEGVERAARERYGMMEPGEQVYIVSDDNRRARNATGPRRPTKTAPSWPASSAGSLRRLGWQPGARPACQA